MQVVHHKESNVSKTWSRDECAKHAETTLKHSMRFWKFMPGGSCLEKLFYVGPLNDKPNAEVIIVFRKAPKEEPTKQAPVSRIASTKLMKPHRRL